MGIREDLQKGLAYLDAKDFDRASKIANRALKIDARNPTSHLILGNVALQSKRLKVARTHFEQGLKGSVSQESRATFLNNIGAVLMMEEKFIEAAECFERALQSKPWDMDFKGNIAYACYRGGQYEKAQRLYEELLPQTSDKASAWHRIGSCQYLQEQKDEALESYRKALQSPGITPSLIADIAKVFNVYHLLEEERAFLDEALAKFPNHPELLMEVATCESRNSNIEEALGILKKIDLRALTVDLRAQVFAEIGHTLDKLGRFAEAYAHFDASAQQRKQIFQRIKLYKSRDTLQNYAPLVANLSGLMERWRSQVVAPIRTPVFVVGFPRSGTTLMERILDSHSQISALSEPDTISSVENYLDRQYGNHVQSLVNLSEREVSHLREMYWQQAQKAASFGDDSLVVDKNPNFAMRAPLILRLFPDAKFIYCMRHPADCTLSAFIQNFIPNQDTAFFLSLEDTVDRFVKIQENWDRIAAQLNQQSQVLIYERLLDDFEGELRQVCAFLGLEYEPKMALFHEDARRKRILTPSYQQVIHPVYKSSTKRFRNYFAQLEPLLPKLQPYLERYGYEL